MSNQSEQHNQPDNSAGKKVFLIIIVIVLAIILYMFSGEPEQAPVTVAPEAKVKPIEPEPVTPIVEPEPTPEPEPEPVAPEPVEEKVALPELSQSDVFAKSILEQLSFDKSMLDLVISDDLIRRTVVFAENFSRGELAYSHLPLKPLQQKYQVTESGLVEDGFQVDENNWQRYQQYVDLLQSFEPQQLVAAYQQMQPLFEQAYEELGFPEQTFDDVIESCLQRILDAKVATGDEVLVQPKVVYEYQDQQIENMNEADKLLMRLGRENLLKLKAVALELDRAMKSKEP
ncbi:DUF3014 domain-containing protein [Thalassotalea sp. Y01]|uniref:DUF3014 domain-containing protein n=1 Tax=Thalassotalea sp. Y01 TaxID=2729613 RepID=UPI00145DB31E|nr:DUF3014 domain-containing protein [Thalassotalea sp. Y01]NMP17559.1 DUF3014 domain-containing protein [Thalassotalea sp. Y01]